MKQRAPLTILDAINDPRLFAPWFKDRATWQAWFAFLCALFALPLSTKQLDIYRACTGRANPPASVAREAWLCCGRRAGKSFVLALVAVFLGCFFDYRPYLAPGERGTVVIVATDRRQARAIMRYIRALLNDVPMLRLLVEREVAEGFDLSNGISIEVGTASFRSLRSLTCVAQLCDEIAFWPSDENSAEPDFEVLNALRPAMATIPTAMLLCASSPYARRGALWDAHRRHYGKDDDPVLVWQAPTRTMNPSVPQSFIDAEYDRDPSSAAAEYGATFRTDIESFIAREVVEACIAPGVHERSPVPGIKYSAFVDPSGGSADSFTLAIAHKEGDAAILDAVRERKPPFSPEEVVSEYAALLKSYRVNKIIGDRYAGEWPRERFKVHGVIYDPAAKAKSDLYRDMLPILNSRKADLLDHPKLLTQLVGLERRTARGGKDSIDHAPSAHDDVCNAVAGVLTNMSSNKHGSYRADLSWVGDPNDTWRDLMLLRHIGGYR